MIRWRFVLTRLIVVIAAITLLVAGLGRVVGYVSVAAIETVTGAKVEVAQTRVGLFPPRIHYDDIAIADPRDGKAMRNAITADSVSLTIDGDALLRRRWVVSDGSITGLEIDTARETSGHLGEVEEEPASVSDQPSMLGRILRGAAGSLSDQSEELYKDLETVRVSKRLKGDWQKRYKDLTDRAESLERQIRTVRDQAKGIENPLRDWQQLESTLAEARQLRSEWLTVGEELNSLPSQLQLQMAELDTARQIDLQRASQYVPEGVINNNSVDLDILAEAVRQQVDRVRGYLDGGKKIADYTVVSPESDRIRGVTHDLDVVQRPELLIRRCTVSGLMRSGGTTYALSGRLYNLAPTPELLEEPTRFRARLEGPEVLEIDYVRDRRRGEDVDHVTLLWPTTDVKPLMLGNAHDAGIKIEGGQRELWVQLKIDGDQVNGQLISKQTGLKMTLATHPKYATTPAARAIQSSLAGVDRLKIDARFDGTWDDLDMKISTNLGSIFQDAARQAAVEQIAVFRRQRTEAINKAYNQQAAELNALIGTNQNQANALLATANKSIEEMSQKVLKEVGDADVYLGRLRSAIRGPLR